MCVCGCVCLCRGRDLFRGLYDCGGWQTPNLQGGLETQRRGDIAARAQGRLEAEVSPPRGTSVFSLRPSTGWMRPAHIVEGHVLSSESTYVMLGSSRNTFAANNHIQTRV